MEDNLISTYRPSMRKNCLLRRPKLGQVPISTYKLPKPEYRYGAKTVFDGGINSVISSYEVHKPSRRPRKHFTDYVKMNIHSSQAGNATRSERKQFHSACVKDPAYLFNDYEKIKFIKVPDIRFGDRSKINETVASLLTEKFRDLEIDKLKLKEQRRREKDEAIKNRKAQSPRRVEVMREMLSHQKPELEKPLWKMSKFCKVKSKISTFRKPSQEVCC